ncbi:hypothetical protein OIU78_004420 [Salix suchowensis]|nr:hypothetical protein OIU78_004420 [Salix suchowensis]
MGSLLQLQDLNLAPSPFSSLTSTSTPAAASTSSNTIATSLSAKETAKAFLVPKLEPKLEPFDVETPIYHHQPQDPGSSTHAFLLASSAPNYFSNSQLTTPLSQSISSEDDNANDHYSEYNRISEHFRTAFAKRLQDQYGDISVVSDPDSRAIVPHNEDDNSTIALSTVVVSRRPKYPQRSSELVRVTDLGIEDQRYFRDLVRRTRMVYDSLRILSILEEKRRGERRARGDLRAASAMRDCGLWLNRDKRIVGSILKFSESLRTKPLTVRPRGYLSLDVSNKKENMPVFLFNDIDNDHDPLCYQYLERTVFPVFVFTNGSNGTGCDCVSGCKWGDLSQIYPNYTRPSYPELPPLDFAMDVSKMRNVACYMSHSSAPNVLVQFVLYDHNNLMYPHIMLFAMENIPPLRELSLDYGVADDWTGKLAICN